VEVHIVAQKDAEENRCSKMTGINFIIIFSGAQVRPGLMDIVKKTVGRQIDHDFFCARDHETRFRGSGFRGSRSGRGIGWKPAYAKGDNST